MIDEEEAPVKVCGSCSDTLKYETVFLFELDHIRKYTFHCETCNISYDVYINNKTKFRASYQCLLDD